MYVAGGWTPLPHPRLGVRGGAHNAGRGVEQVMQTCSRTVQSLLCLAVSNCCQTSTTFVSVSRATRTEDSNSFQLAAISLQTVAETSNLLEFSCFISAFNPKYSGYKRSSFHASRCHVPALPSDSNASVFEAKSRRAFWRLIAKAGSSPIQRTSTSIEHVPRHASRMGSPALAKSTISAAAAGSNCLTGRPVAVAPTSARSGAEGWSARSASAEVACFLLGLRRVSVRAFFTGGFAARESGAAVFDFVGIAPA